jgi:hypothetical protein
MPTAEMTRELLYRGQLVHLKASPFAWLIFPFVQLKRLLEVLYDFLARSIWKELVRGENSESELMNLAAFVVFCFLSWLSFVSEGHAQLIFLISLSVWSIDWGWAIASYSHPQHQIHVQLFESDTGDLIWQTRYPNCPRHETEVDRTAIARLLLERQTLTAGAFSHPVGEPWQLSLATQTGNRYFLDLCRDLDSLLPKARELGDRLEIPLNFADSYGNNPYATHSLADLALPNMPRSPSILLQKSPKRWQVSTRWGWRHSWQLLLQVASESGFLVFLLFLATYMTAFGGFIHSLFTFGRGEPLIIDPVAGLRLNWGWGQGTDIAIVIGIILYNGWKMSQIRRVQVDRYFLRYAIGAKMIAQLRTEQIRALLLLGRGDSELLILAEKKALSLGHFPQGMESLTFLELLAEGIQYFQPNPPPESLS